MAAGLSIREADFLTFKTAFEQVVRSLITAEELQELIETDGSLDTQVMSLNTARLLATQVWGQGFAPPLFYDQFKVLQQRILAEKHLKLTVEKNQQRFEAIYFNHSTPLPAQTHLVYQLQVNEFNGQHTLQLQIKHAHN